MPILVGIDEAGYGPLLGPLVSAASIWRVTPDCVDGDLWRPLSECVVKAGKRGEWRMVVNDSKKVFSRSKEIGSLERPVLAFARAADLDTETVAGLLTSLGASLQSRLPWHQDLSAPLPLDRPRAASPELVDKLRRIMAASGAVCVGLAAEVVAEDAYNARVAQTRNKAAVLLERVLRLVDRTTRDLDGEREAFIYIDRLGGRSHYRDLLMDAFPDRELRIVEETAERSAYVLTRDGASWTFDFAVEADQHRLPVALASMTAKYVREMLMAQFNAYWRRLAPDVAPTAGYYTDAQRFLKDIAPVLTADAPPVAEFVRAK